MDKLKHTLNNLTAGQKMSFYEIDYRQLFREGKNHLQNVFLKLLQVKSN